jgi:hypothetical protein
LHGDLLELDPLEARALEQAKARAEQHRHEVDPELVDQR